MISDCIYMNLNVFLSKPFWGTWILRRILFTLPGSHALLHQLKANKHTNPFTAQCDSHRPFFVQESQFFQHYELCLSGPPLGEGSFSVCRMCRHKQSNHEYAVKIVSRRLVEMWCCSCICVIAFGLCAFYFITVIWWHKSEKVVVDAECVFWLLGWRQTPRGRSLLWGNVSLTQTSSSCMKSTQIR